MAFPPIGHCGWSLLTSTGLPGRCVLQDPQSPAPFGPCLSRAPRACVVSRQTGVWWILWAVLRDWLRCGASVASGMPVGPLPPLCDQPPTFGPLTHPPPATAAFLLVSQQILCPLVCPEHSLPHPHTPWDQAFPDCPTQNFSLPPPVSCLPSLNFPTAFGLFNIFIIFAILLWDEVHRESVSCRELLLAHTQEILVESVIVMSLVTPVQRSDFVTWSHCEWVLSTYRLWVLREVCGEPLAHWERTASYTIRGVLETSL